MPGGADDGGVPFLVPDPLRGPRLRLLAGRCRGLGAQLAAPDDAALAHAPLGHFRRRGAGAPKIGRQGFDLFIARPGNRLSPGDFCGRDGATTVAPATTSSLILASKAGVIVSTCGNTSKR